VQTFADDRLLRCAFAAAVSCTSDVIAVHAVEDLDVNRTQCDTIYELSCCSRGAQLLAAQIHDLNQTSVTGFNDSQLFATRLEQCNLQRTPVCVRPGIASQLLIGRLALLGPEFSYYQQNPVQVERAFRRDLADLINREVNNDADQISENDILILNATGAPANASAAFRGGNVTIFSYQIRTGMRCQSVSTGAGSTCQFGTLVQRAIG